MDTRKWNTDASLDRGNIVRTTIRRDDGLPDDARQLAVKHGTTLTATSEEPLQEPPARSRTAAPGQRTRLTATGEGGTLPGIDLDDLASLFDTMHGRH